MSRRNPGLQCGSFFRRYFHGSCVEIVGARLDSLLNGVSWTCVDCRDRSRRYFDKLQIQEQLGSLSSGALQEIRAELKQIREQQPMLLQFCCDKISAFEMEMNKLNEYIKKTDQISIENNELKLHTTEYFAE